MRRRIVIATVLMILGIAIAGVQAVSLLVTQTNNCVAVWTSRLGTPSGSSVSRDSEHLVVAYGYTLRLFSKSSNRPLWNLSLYTLPRTPGQSDVVSISGDGSFVSLGGSGSYVIPLITRQGVVQWSFVPSQDTTSISSQGGPSTAVALSGDGQYLAAVAARTGVADTLYVFHTRRNVPLWSYNLTLLTNQDYRGLLAISHEGGYVATVAPRNGTLYLFSNRDNQTLWTSNTGGTSLVMSDSGDRIATANGRVVRVFGKTTNDTLMTITLDSAVADLAMSSDGSTLGLVEGDTYYETTKLAVYDLRSRSEVFRRSPVFPYPSGYSSGSPGNAETVSISEAGDRIVVGSTNVGALVYDMQGNEVCSIQALGGSTQFGTKTEVANDGRFLMLQGAALFETRTPIRFLWVETAVIATGASVATSATAYLLIMKRRPLKTNGRIVPS